MKKLKNLKLVVLVSTFILLTQNCFAVVIIPLPHMEGTYEQKRMVYLALWISFDLLFLAFFALRVLVWIVFRPRLKRNRWTFYGYTIYRDDEYGRMYLQNWITMSFVGVNGLGVAVVVLVYLMDWIIGTI
ncbi:MAG TPA: hypothetical protein PKC87_05560 [Candidatus Absconditabacterales bacterium]|nr:hypothetical protein [Candidatus Absconditabacterales bacterium]